MKTRYLSLLLSAALGPASLSAANLLVNPGFEADPVEDPTIPPDTGWISFGNALVEADPDQQSGGSQGLKMYQDFTGRINASGVFQEVPVTAGGKYKLSALVRNGAATGVDPRDPLQQGNSALIKIEWVDEFDTILHAFEDTLNASIDPKAPCGAWQQLELVDLAPEGAAFARVILLHLYVGDGLEGGSSWFDDVNFETTTDLLPTEKAGNLIANGDFSGTANGGPPDAFTGWTEFVNVYQEFSGSGISAPSPTLAFRLASAKMFQNFIGADNASGLYQDIPVTVGTSYLFTARARSGVGGDEERLGAGNRGILKIEWLDGNGEFLVGEAVEDPSTGQIDSTTTPGVWEQLAISGVAPAGAVKARTFILHVYEGSGFEGGSSWYDDVCFQVGTLPPPATVVLTDVAFDSDIATVQWPGEANCTYTLEKSTDLKCWTPVAESIPGADALLSANDDAAVEPTAFYRIVKFTN